MTEVEGSRYKDDVIGRNPPATNEWELTNECGFPDPQRSSAGPGRVGGNSIARFTISDLPSVSNIHVGS